MAQSESSTDPLNIDKLRAINRKLGDFPVTQTATGERVPTGTVGTLLLNIREYDALVAKEGRTNEDERQLEELRAQMTLPIPFLKKVGLFDLFSAEEWANGSGAKASPGRRLVGEAARSMGIE